MSMNDLEQAFDLIYANGDQSFFAGQKPEALICRAEDALGLKFSPTYRRFLGRFGCGSIAGVEFYGLVDNDFENSRVPDGIWLTLDERRTSRLPEDLVLVGDTGDGA